MDDMKPTSEQVEQWAREAGCLLQWAASGQRLGRFAAIAYAAGQEAEREACAKAASLFSIEKNAIHPDIGFTEMSKDAQYVCHMACQCVADAIHARSVKD